ncbi:MAG: leucyl aminopeptidase family protein [Planctomycetes bacterium]|nr:leucyl aminopeptidase family protein [Planctomycetota bacterium]
MSRLELVRGWFAARSAPDSLLVLAPRAAARHRDFLASAPKHVPTALLRRLATTIEPGDNGAVAASLVEDGVPGHVELAVLPDQVSRYNAPSRAEAVRRSTAVAKKPGERGVIVVVVDDPSHALPVANAVGRAMPALSLKSSRSPTARDRTGLLVVDHRGRPVTIDVGVAEVVAANRDAARLVDVPPTDLDPKALAHAAREQLRGIRGVRIREIAGAELLRHGLRGIHAVGRCARSEPRLLIATIAPRGSRGPHVALVGKGLTYDTGGLHLKARGSMETMKCDMGGAAAVLGAFRVLARRAPCRMTLVLCIAENAIGPSAYKPDDVLVMHSGKTVEINNTDAEGRLVLADGISYAVRVLGADIVLDAATLTGAQMIATGLNHAAVVSNDAGLEELFVRCGRECGDLVHPLPFAPEFYRQEFASPLADLRNSVKDRNNAQTSCAAQFIHEHVGDAKVRWLHVDLAGPAFRDQRGTGYGVALFAAAVASLASEGGPAPRRKRGPRVLTRSRRSR